MISSLRLRLLRLQRCYQFKDFLEGMVSTTQTGGDIKSYFSQKAEEAMMNYKMDRQSILRPSRHTLIYTQAYS